MKYLTFHTLLILVFFVLFGCTSKNQNKESQMIGHLPLCWFSNIGDTLPPTVKNTNNPLGFVIDNFNYPISARKNNIQGNIITLLTIKPNGEISNIRIINGLTKDCNEEVIRVLKLLKWNPATIKEKPVQFTFLFPITLTLK